MNYNYYETEARCRKYVQDAQRDIKRTMFRWTIIFGILFGITLLLNMMLGRDLKEPMRIMFFTFLSVSILNIICFTAPWCYVKLSMARLRKQIIKIRALADEDKG